MIADNGKVYKVGFGIVAEIGAVAPVRIGAVVPQPVRSHRDKVAGADDEVAIHVPCRQSRRLEISGDVIRRGIGVIDEIRCLVTQAQGQRPQVIRATPSVQANGRATEMQGDELITRLQCRLATCDVDDFIGIVIEPSMNAIRRRFLDMNADFDIEAFEEPIAIRVGCRLGVDGRKSMRQLRELSVSVGGARMLAMIDL